MNMLKLRMLSSGVGGYDRANNALPHWQSVTIGCGMGLVFVLSAIFAEPWAICLAAVGVVVCLTAFTSPSIALLIVILLIPLERIGRITEDTAVYTISIMRIAGLVALASLFFHGLICKWKFRFGAPYLLYSGYLLCCLTSLLYTREYNESLRAIGMIAGNLLFLFSVINISNSWRFVRIAIMLWLFATVMIGLYTAYDWHYGEAVEEAAIGSSQTRGGTVYIDSSEYEALRVVKRAIGPTSSPGVYGINLIMTLPFFFVIIRFQTTLFGKALSWIGFAVVLYNLFLTNTRATLLVGLGTIALCALFGLIRINQKGIVIIGMVLLGLLLLIPRDVHWRMLNAANYSLRQSQTLAARVQYWGAAIEVAKEHWLWGIGIGTREAIARKLSMEHQPEQTAVHNEYMATLLELGVIGWTLFMSFLTTVVWTIYRMTVLYKEKHKDTYSCWFYRASMVGTLSVFIYGLQVDVFHMPLKGWWLIAGLCLGMSKMSQESLQEWRSVSKLA
jgi:hypothetical protein